MYDAGVEYEPKGIEFAAMDANDEGLEASERGRPLAVNPYKRGTRLSLAWADGWRTQQANQEQAADEQ